MYIYIYILGTKIIYITRCRGQGIIFFGAGRRGSQLHSYLHNHPPTLPPKPNTHSSIHSNRRRQRRDASAIDRPLPTATVYSLPPLNYTTRRGKPRRHASPAPLLQPPRARGIPSDDVRTWP